MNELTITDFYMIPNDNKLISRNELNPLPTSTYYIIKRIKTNNIVLYTAIKHTGLPPEPIPISFDDFKDALKLANYYSYEELMKMANDTKPNNLAKIAIYLGICKKPLPHAINSMIQQLHSVPEVNTILSNAITKAIQEIQKNSRARTIANMDSIRAARRAKNWTNAVKRTAATRNAAKILFSKGQINQKYMNTAIGLAKTVSNEAKSATAFVADLEASQITTDSKKAYEDAKKEYEDAKKEYDTITNINKSDIDFAKEKLDKANLVYDKATKYAKAAIAYASIVKNTSVSDKATEAANEAKAERIKINTAYFKLIMDKRGGRNKTNRKYKKSQHRKFKTQYRKRSLRIR